MPWVYLRAVYFILVRGRLRTLQSGDVVKANIMHNVKWIYGANNRMNLLLYPAAVIETLHADWRILIAGRRNENGLYSLVGLGLRLENIRRLDLMSYSPHIELGDMHAMPFADYSFDAVICGWTLSYSTNPAKAAREMMRIAKPGAIIAIGVEYSRFSPQDEQALIGYQIQEFDKTGDRIKSRSCSRITSIRSFSSTMRLEGCRTGPLSWCCAERGRGFPFGGLG